MENKIIIGIYKIKNKENGKVYIGSSKNIENRWKQHKTLLRCGKHHSQHLQYSWNKYGSDCFLFEVIEDEIQQEESLVREQYWIDKLQSYNPKRGYNMSIVAGACVMNDNYNFEEIVDEEYELENKYKIIYLIMNLKEKEIAYQISDRFKNVSTFNDFIFEIYKHLLYVNFKTWVTITIYTNDHQIDLDDLSELPLDVCERVFYSNDFKRVKIFDGQIGSTDILYKDNFKWFKNKLCDNNKYSDSNYLDITVYDGFDLISTGISYNK